MDWIAQYWWLWLSGLLAVLAVVAFRSLTGMYGLAKDTAQLADKLRRTSELSSDERRRHLTEVGMDIVTDKIKKRIERLIVNLVLLSVAGVCGVLLAIALIWKFA